MPDRTASPQLFPQVPPLVSVVVPTANRLEPLRRCLDSLRAQEYPQDRFEIVVVHNGEHRDSIRARLEDEAGPAVRHLTLAGADANAARNFGISAARGDPICLVDDDVVAPGPWLRALVEGLLRHTEADCAGGPVRPLFDRAPPRTCDRHELRSEVLDEGDREGQVGEVWGGNMAVRRAAIARVGPFRPGLARSQEWEWQQRLLAAGGSIVYVPDAGLLHVRSAADVALGTLVRETFLRGYLVGRLRPRKRAWLLPARAATALSHAARRRCTVGLTDAARRVGELCGTVAAIRGAP
jgi:glycosyltransferase involved in cell wall biosynthesis